MFPCHGAFAGYRVVHADEQRQVFTLERERRLFKGPYVVASKRALVAGVRDPRLLEGLVLPAEFSSRP